MGAQGPDVWLSGRARADFPYAIECKNVEKINVWKAWEQAKAHVAAEPLGTDLRPLVVFSKNNEEMLVIVELREFLHQVER